MRGGWRNWNPPEPPLFARCLRGHLNILYFVQRSRDLLLNVGSLSLSSIRGLVGLVKLKHGERSRPAGRSAERYRRIALSAGASAIAQGIGVLTALISVPLTLNYLGAERYGLWLVISSVIAVLGFADLGIGNGLINLISEAHGEEDHEKASEYVSHALFMLSVVGITIGGIFAFLYPFIPWERVFNISSAAAIAESGPAMAVFMACFVLNIPLGSVQKIQMGYQEGFVNSLWQSGGSLLGLICVLLAIYLKAGLPWLVLAMSGAPLMMTVLNGVILFGFRRPWLRPRLKSLSAKTCRRILKFGLFFFVLQLAGAVGFQSDNLVIAYLLGAHQLPQYAVPMKLFTLIPMALNLMLNPLWPAYGEAMARKDFVWIRRAFTHSVLLTWGMALVPSIMLVLFGQEVIQLWVGPEIRPSGLLLLGFGTWAVIYSLSISTAMLLNGVNIIRFQVIFAVLMGCSNLAISIVLVRLFGVVGAVLGTVIALSLFSLLPSAIYIWKMFDKWRHQYETQIEPAETVG